MYSQHDEEEVILEHAPATGRFLDVGAYDFVQFSNTRALAERGWSGALIEPSPEAFTRLLGNAAGFKNLDLLNCVASTGAEGLVRFYTNDAAVASTDEKHVKKWSQHVKFTPIYSVAVSIGRIVRQFGPFDFINIDTEFTSFSILKGLDLDEAKCNLVCVEIDDDQQAMAEYLSSKGFEVIHITTENMIAKRR